MNSLLFVLHDQWGSFSLDWFLPLLTVFRDEILGCLMASLNVGVQQIWVVDVSVQVDFCSLHFVELLNAVIELGDVSKLKLTLVNLFCVSREGQILVIILGILKLFLDLEGLCE